MPTFFTTTSGLRVLIEELPHTHSVSLGCFVGVGARHEQAELSGAAHFIEHMCFKGTRFFPTAKVISQTIEGVGGILNAATSYESTVYWGKVADIHFDRLLHLIADLICHPLFDLRELEKERKVIIEEIRGTQDTPDEWIYDVLHAAAWGRQPLGRDIAGTVESVSAIDRHDLLQFWQIGYNLHNMVISVAGNVRAAEVLAKIEAAFAAAPLSSAAPMPLISGAYQPGPSFTLRPRETEQAHFCIGFPGLSFADTDRRALQVLDTVLGGGMSSRLFQVLREDHGLAYNIGSYHSEFADTGMWVVYGSVETEALRDSLVLSFEILSDLAAHGITAEELALVKEQVKGGILLSLEDTWAVASRNGSHMLRYGKVIPVEQVVAEVEAVSAADVQRIAQALLNPQHMHVAVVGPYDAEDTSELEQVVAMFTR